MRAHATATLPARALRRALLGAASVALVAGCSSEPASDGLLELPRLQVAHAAEVVQTRTSSALAAARLGSGAYTVPGWDSRILLENGQWEDVAQRAMAQMSEGLHALGDFDGDGETEAATVLTLGTGGMELRFYLLGVGSLGNRITQEAALLLGERVQVRGIRSVNDRLQVDMLTSGPGDAPCCPTREVTREYVIRGGNWVPR